MSVLAKLPEARPLCHSIPLVTHTQNTQNAFYYSKENVMLYRVIWINT
jgi:hypothetical protein